MSNYNEPIPKTCEGDRHRIELDSELFMENGEQRPRLSSLEEAALAGDESAFLIAVKELKDAEWLSSDFVRIIRMALEAGAYQMAREISTRGADRYPSDSELQKFAHILGPPKIVRRLPKTNIDLAANRHWMKQNGKEYRGQWVAVKNGKLLGSGPTLDAAVEKIEDTKDVLLTIAY